MKDFPLSDAHTHIRDQAEFDERCRDGILSLACASVPAEAEKLFAHRHPFIIPTAGLHPWHAGDFSVSQMTPWLTKASVIGEIGMDSVWCTTPLSCQEEAFRSQLALAAQQNKPVILHTKGQEAEIASILREFPNTYLVHWYSCKNHLEKYLELDCYFSIGPDVWWNPAVQEVARHAPLSRIVIETDGMSAVKWAYEEAPASPNPPSVPLSPRDSLFRTLLTAAKIRHLPPEDAGYQFYQNLTEGFLAAGQP